MKRDKYRVYYYDRQTNEYTPYSDKPLTKTQADAVIKYNLSMGIIMTKKVDK